jgi:D-lactate dehydrogenase (cytochrome)
MACASRPGPDALAAALSQLRARFGERLAESTAVRRQHGNQLSEVPNEPPDAVLFPQTTGEVADAVRICAKQRIPIIPFGVGSSFEGHINAPFGGLSIDTSRMKRIVAVRVDDLDCTVEAGVTRSELNQHLRDTGLFFPIDPGADASLGGMAATRASGTNAVRYGTMRDNVLALTIVLPDGSVSRTGTRARKSSAGYDLTRLIVGSEGTFAVVTEITLKLSGIPEEISGGVCPFPSIEAACNAVIATIQTGIPVARIELMDEIQARACNAYSRLDLPETPLLFLEFHGSAAGVREQSARFNDIAAEFDGGPFDWAIQAEDRSRLWRARHDAYWAARATPECQGHFHRRLRADIAAGGLCRRDKIGHRRERTRGADRRPCGRRQFSRAAADRLLEPCGSGARLCLRRAAGEARVGARRHLDRRARHRAIKSAVLGAGIRFRRARNDARRQARHRPGQHHEPRQGAAGFLEARALP